MSDGPRHLYIHFPFCRAKCDYCDFYSVPMAASGEARGRGRSSVLSTGDAYIAAVHREWELERARWSVRRLETVYLGGGSPSLLGEEGLERLLKPFQPLLAPHAEVTVETNPDDVTAGYAAWASAWRAGARPAGARPAGARCEGGGDGVGACGVKDGGLRGNHVGVRSGVRISLGVQSFLPRLRRELGRRAAADPAAAHRLLREAGVENLGVDLIFGVPEQGVAEIDEDLRAIAELRPDHVSWYELDVVAGSALERRLRRRQRREEERALRDDVSRTHDMSGGAAGVDEPQGDLYRRIVRGLEHLGYRWYEVSNFARPGRRSRHNMAYWQGRSYLGLGPSAVSTVGGVRWRDVPDVDAYVRWAAEAGPLASSTVRHGNPMGVDGDDGEQEPAAPREVERLDEVTRARERLLLAARIGAAVDLSEVAAALDRAALEPLARAGFILLNGGKLRVARKGRYVANEVCVRLFRDFSFLEGRHGSEA